MALPVKSSTDNQSEVILEMERKLNPTAFWRRLRKNDKYARITTAQYWDWLTYIDVSTCKHRIVIDSLIADYSCRTIILLSGKCSR